MATKNVRVLGRNFKIVVRDLGNMYGLCDKAAAVISIDPEQDEFSFRDTLLHEIMHAILHQQGATHSYKLEESFVRPLATGIMTVMQDNPKLAEALFGKIK